MSRLRLETAFEPTPERVTSQIGPSPGDATAHEVPALVVAWSLREPGRVGEVALFDDYTARVIGRGGARADDGAPRAVFSRQRPGGLERRPALGGPSISRKHVRLTPDTEGIAIERLGKGTVIIDGELADAGFIAPGGTLMLSNELLFVCERRPSRLLAGTQPNAATFPFGGTDPLGLTGETPAAWRLRDQARFVAGAGSPLLVHGASGAGKEVVARAVHHASAWRDRPWLMLGGATLTRAELEQVQARTDAPLVVIDELTEVPPEIQPHLARLINHTLSMPLPRPRIVATSIAAGAQAEQVRPDLMSRFILNLRVPALSERCADIPLLARAILKDIAVEQPEVARRFFAPLPDDEDGQATEPRLAPKLIDLMLRHRWQANIRELTALLWSSMTTAVSPFLDATPEVITQLRDTTETYNDPNALDASAIRQALDASQGRVVVAARMLGLKNRWVLYRLMEKLDIRA